MSAFRRIAAAPHLVALGGIVLLGALLRFATLDLQSYRYDEAVTVGRVLHPDLLSTLSAVTTASRRRRCTTSSPGSGRDRSGPAKSGCVRYRRWTPAPMRWSSC
jgi:hypothetical protein